MRLVSPAMPKPVWLVRTLWMLPCCHWPVLKRGFTPIPDNLALASLGEAAVGIEKFGDGPKSTR